MSQSKIIAVDLAKDVFEIGISNRAFRMISRKRLGRSGFRKLLTTEPAALVVMEACGTAHYWGREAQALGHDVKIIPAQYVRPYRRRNKTDRGDVEALIEAHRCEGIRAVPVRSVEQQQIQQLHRLREQWKKTRTGRINLLRGCLRELGVVIPLGASRAMKGFAEALDNEALPAPLRQAFAQVITEIRQLEEHIHGCEKQLTCLTRDNPAVATLARIQGVGLLTSTAMVAAAGTPEHFRSSRHFASWLGLTPREYSSGKRRYLGRISKQGDKYLRTLLIHGARSFLLQARRRTNAGLPLNRLQRWAIDVHQRTGHNKAAVAVANKLARICWAVWQHQRKYYGDFASNVAASINPTHTLAIRPTSS